MKEGRRRLEAELSEAHKYIPAVKAVVKESMHKLAENGNVRDYPIYPSVVVSKDSLGRMKREVYVAAGNSLFAITDARVKEKDNVVESIGHPDDGLFIEEIKLDSENTPVSYGVSIQLPRHPKGIQENYLLHLLRLKPSDLGEVADKIKNGEIIDVNYYLAAAHQLESSKVA